MPGRAIFQPTDITDLGDQLQFEQQASNDIWSLGFGHQATRDISALGQIGAPSSPAPPPAAAGDAMGVGMQALPQSAPVVVSPRPSAEGVSVMQSAWQRLMGGPDPSAAQPAPAAAPAAPSSSPPPPSADGSMPSFPSLPGGGAPGQSMGPSAMGTGAPAASSAPSGSWAQRAYAAAVAAGHPNPAEFVAQMRWESGQFDPDVISGKRASPAGAQGIAQIMPEVASGAGVDPLNPDAALAYAASRMANAYQTYGGDSDQALASYNMGAGNLAKYGPHGLPETHQYITQIHSMTPGEAAQAQATPPPAPAPQQQSYAPPPGTYRGDLVPNQLMQGQAEGLSPQEAMAICGPAAAVAFARANGRTPSLTEAKDLASRLGVWDVNQGMSGPQGEVQLLSQMGVPSTMQPGADEAAMAQEVQAGRPVIVDTPGHYFVAQNYDPATGQFDFGESANVLAASGGRTRYRLDEIPSLRMGAPRSTIYMQGGR